MKRIFLITLCLLIAQFSFSQFYQYADGPVFPYPTSGNGKMVSVKGGGIMYLQINPDSAIHIQYYEPKYHMMTQELVKPDFFPITNGHIENVFSFNGDAFIFISTHSGDSSSLFRIVIDGSNGKLKKSERVIHMHAQKSKRRDHPTPPDYIVRCADDEQAYGIGIVNPGKYDNQPVLQLSVFDRSGNELKRPYKSSDPEKFPNLRAVDLVVMSPQQAVLLTWGSNVLQYGGEDGDVITAKLERSKPELTITSLYFSNDLILQHAVARYDSLFQKIFLVSAAKRQSQKGRLVTDIVRIDIPAMKIENDAILGFNESLNSKLSQLTEEQMPVFAPVEFMLKGKTNLLVVYQQLIEGNSDGDQSETKINHTVFAEYNDDYQMVKAYLVPSKAVVKMAVEPFYLHQQELTGVSFGKDNQYRTGKFITDNFHYFWVLNDVASNNASTDGSRLSEFDNNRNAASFYTNLSGESLMPHKMFLAGKPNDKGGNHLLIPGVGYFDPLNGVWVTLQDESKGEPQGLKLVWLQPY